MRSINEYQASLSPQRKQEFREIAPLLTRIIKAHIELEGKIVISEALNFEAYQLDA